MTDAPAGTLDALDGPDRLLCALRAQGKDVYAMVSTQDVKAIAEALGYHPRTGKDWMYALRDQGVLQTLVRGEYAIRPGAEGRLESLRAEAVEEAREALELHNLLND